MLGRPLAVSRGNFRAIVSRRAPGLAMTIARNSRRKPLSTLNPRPARSVSGTPVVRLTVPTPTRVRFCERPGDAQWR